MTPEEYDAFVDDVHARYDDETAARMIEDTCHPPYRRPRRDVLFPPALSRAVAGDGTLAVTESARSATGPQDGAA